MATLDAILGDIYNGYGGNRYSSESFFLPKYSKYMVVPMHEEKFEMPAFILPKIRRNRDYENLDYLLVTLKPSDYDAGYRSIEATMKFALRSKADCKFIKIPSSSPDTYYYGCYGSLFDMNLRPIVMLTWQVEKGPVCNLYKKPLLRIDPMVMNRSDNVLRFASGKLLTTILNECLIYSPNSLGCPNYMHAAVIIDTIPFKVKSVAPPTINDTRDSMLEIAKTDPLPLVDIHDC